MVLVSAILPFVLPSASSGSSVPERCTPADGDSCNARVSPSEPARWCDSWPYLDGDASADHANLDRDPSTDHTNLDRDPSTDHANVDRDACAEHANVDRDARAEHANVDRDARAERSRCLGEQISAQRSSRAKRGTTAE
jgi:hypothetical protein